MWAILKFERKELGLLKSQLKERLGKDHSIYQPKMMMQSFKKNKLIKKEFNLLGNYLFLYNKSETEKILIDKIKYLKGVKYFLNGFSIYQTEIKDFINKCRSSENEQGFISQSFLEIKMDIDYKFSSGPFTQKIFKIIDVQKNKIKILMGSISATINKKDQLFSPL